MRLNKQQEFELERYTQSPFFFNFTLCRTFLSHFLNFFCSKLWGLCISLKLKLLLFIKSHFFFFFTLCRKFFMVILFLFLKSPFFFYFTFCSTFLLMTLFVLFFSLFSCFRCSL